MFGRAIVTPNPNQQNDNQILHWNKSHIKNSHDLIAILFGRSNGTSATNNAGETKRLGLERLWRWEEKRGRDVWSGTCQLVPSVICHTNNSSASGPYTTSPPLLPIAFATTGVITIFAANPNNTISTWFGLSLMIHTMCPHCDHLHSHFTHKKKMFYEKYSSVGRQWEWGQVCFIWNCAPSPSCKKLQQWSTQLTRVIVGTLCNSQNTC